MDCLDVEFSTDLVNSAYLHLCFLDKADNFEQILKGETLKHGLKRYEQLWLPLAYENRGVEMVAPIDVYWLWYIHMLQPLAYRRDCRKMLKSTLDHHFKAENKIIPFTNNAIEIWYDNYPKEGFNIIRNEEYVQPLRNKGQVDMDAPSKLSVDLVALAETHMQFCYQVALPHFRDKKYLENADKRYKQFLLLKTMEPEEFLTPSVDILLMWYTHMCNPIAYGHDLMQICGKILDNNVKVKSALITDRFILAREKTSELWKRVSAEDLVQPGTKLRSTESRKEILPMTDDDLKDCCVVVYRIYLAHAELQNLPPRMKNSHLNLKIYRLHYEGNAWEEIVFLHGSKRMWAFSTSFVFNTVQHKELRIVLLQTRKLWCIRGKQTIASAKINVRKEFDSMRAMKRTLALDIDLECENGQTIKLTLDGAVDRPLPVLCNLTLQKTNFIMQTLTNKELRRIWGHEGFPKSFLKDQHTCYTATHSLMNHENDESFRCRIMHISELLHSGVEVFFKHKLVASSQLIGSSHLPYPTQVELRDVTMAFDPELGERAMLIRNHNGDWGLCIARWSQDNDGGLEVRFMKLNGKKNKSQCVDIQCADIEFQSFNANLYSGKVMVNPSKNTVAENLATYWSICILYVLCSPRAGDRKLLLTPDPGTRNDDIVPDDNDSQPIYVQERNCQFLVAAGLNTETPSNQYIRDTYGSLTYDLLMDAQDVIVEEQKTSRKLLKKDSVISIDGDMPRKSRKKRSSKLKESIESSRSNPCLPRVFEEPKVSLGITQANTEQEVNSDIDTETKVVVLKPKKLKKRESSKLEDMLAMSDDSITKDEVTETKMYKDERGRKVIIKKQSSHLNEQIAPSDDSVDEEIKELKEFHKGMVVDKDKDEAATSKETGTNMKQYDQLDRPDLSVEMNDQAFVREETRLINGIVEKRKRQASNNGSDSGLDNRVQPVSFDRGVYDRKTSQSSSTEVIDIVPEDTRSDTSSSTRETRSLRLQRIAKDRENMFPLSDEDPQTNATGEVNNQRKRKKSKIKLDVQMTKLDT